MITVRWESRDTASFSFQLLSLYWPWEEDWQPILDASNSPIYTWHEYTSKLVGLAVSVRCSNYRNHINWLIWTGLLLLLCWIFQWTNEYKFVSIDFSFEFENQINVETFAPFQLFGENCFGNFQTHFLFSIAAFELIHNSILRGMIFVLSDHNALQVATRERFWAAKKKATSRVEEKTIFYCCKIKFPS